MASASPARDYDDQDEDEPSSSPSDLQDLTPAINCEVAGENGMYGQFTWTVALPAAPADKDSLADISKIRQFRLIVRDSLQSIVLACSRVHVHTVSRIICSHEERFHLSGLFCALLAPRYTMLFVCCVVSQTLPLIIVFASVKSRFYLSLICIVVCVLCGSDVFEVGGYEWKLEMYPYGDSQSDKTLSVFLCAVDRKQLPGWSQTAHYQIAVVGFPYPVVFQHVERKVR